MKILIVYGTIEGQTRKIARFLEEEAEKNGHQAHITDASDDPPGPEKYDAVILASSVHMSGYNSAILDYALNHKTVLSEKHSAFLSVSLTAAYQESQDEESWQELKEITDLFLKQAHWQPRKVEYVAGALRYTQYSWFKKFIMRQIARQTHHETNDSRDYEYTDYEQMRQFLAHFLKDSKT